MIKASLVGNSALCSQTADDFTPLPGLMSSFTRVRRSRKALYSKLIAQDVLEHYNRIAYTGRLLVPQVRRARYQD